MIFMHPQGQAALRKLISYILIGAGIAILIFPKLIGFLLTFLGCILLSEKATGYAVKKYREVVSFRLKQQ